MSAFYEKCNQNRTKNVYYFHVYQIYGLEDLREKRVQIKNKLFLTDRTLNISKISAQILTLTYLDILNNN